MKKLIILFAFCTNLAFSQNESQTVLNTDSLILQKRIKELEEQVKTLNNITSVNNHNLVYNFETFQERESIKRTTIFLGIGLSLIGGLIKNEDTTKPLKFGLYTISTGCLITSFVLDLDNSKWISLKQRKKQNKKL